MCNDFKDFDRYEDFLTRDVLYIIYKIDNIINRFNRKSILFNEYINVNRY